MEIVKILSACPDLLCDVPKECKHWRHRESLRLDRHGAASCRSGVQWPQKYLEYSCFEFGVTGSADVMLAGEAEALAPAAAAYRAPVVLAWSRISCSVRKVWRILFRS